MKETSTLLGSEKLAKYVDARNLSRLKSSDEGLEVSRYSSTRR